MADDMQNNKPTEKEKAVQAGSDIAEVATKGAASYFGGPVGKAAADKVLNTKAGQSVVRGTGKILSRNPVTRKALAQAQPLISEAKPYADTAIGALGGGSGGEVGPTGATSTGGIVQPTGTTGTATPDHINGLPRQQTSLEGIRRPQSNLASLNSSGEEENINGERKENDNDSLLSDKNSENNDNSGINQSSGSQQSTENDVNQSAKPLDSISEMKKKVTTIKKIIKFLSIPGVLPALGIFIILLFLIILAGGDESDSSGSHLGLNGYTYLQVDNLCDTVKVYNPKTGTYTSELDFETEYIPGVVNAEVGEFSASSDVLKLFAIAARSYAIKNLDDSCTIEGSSRKQAFTFDEDSFKKITSEDSKIYKASMETYGLVIARNGEVVTTYYDAACYRGEDDDNYFIGYGSQTINPEQIQKIPKEWAESRGIMYYINLSKSQNTYCSNNHGMGISQYGAYYLATELNYDYVDLINYYIKDVEINSIYPTISSNYVYTTSAGSTDILTMRLEDFLISQNSSVEEYNEFMLSNIVNAGVGTRDAAVQAALSLVAGLYTNYGVRLPYTYSGQHSSNIPNAAGVNLNHSGTTFYGADPNWGSTIVNESDGLYHYRSSGINYTYTRYGPDCSGFVSWVLHNAGFDNSTSSSVSQGDYGTKRNLNGTRVGNPGDLMWHPGHIMFIVGVDDEKRLYYIAHASCGSEGVKISTISFSDSKNYVVDMTEWYESHKRDITTEQFIEEYRSHELVEYTGAYDNYVTNNNGVYFVGDSRTVGVCYYNSLCDDSSECQNQNCLASVGKGYNWFSNKINVISSNNRKKVVINMGVNDLVGVTDTSSIANKYFDKISQLANNYPAKTFYIVSINPVGESATVSVDAVKSFNSDMKSLIESSDLANIEFLDTYDAIEYSIAGDGIHYTKDTYVSLYNYIIGAI